ncbi:unnamed protein product [Cuscuta epithymum]|uniref:ATP-dependent DNA helicase n=1 Tax=Cuscuta epithymum TaxID=186058 RepID=A0AAV0EH54_9ASTE|nr:unnamed protein product [Cuscuta epithymum]
MIHGPCGVINPQCPCMVLSHGSTDPKCRSKYPHTFSPLTVFDEDCFPSYRRRDTGITVEVRKHKLDNRWIVPYNSHLLRKFDCHINVEVCASVRSVKYIYKYVYKGHDRVSMSLSESGEEGLIDEISDFQKARWVSAPEAAWRIFSFPISQMRPAVLQLQVHLENAHYLTFYGNQRITYITGAMDSMKTMLTQFFAMNASDHVAKSLHLLYVEFPHYFVWNNQRKQWTQRKRKEVIGRLVTVNPMEGERYYLRLLLSNVRGPTSFVDLKSVGSDAMATYRAAAERLGLLSGDFVIRASLDEAVLFQLPSSLRRLFATHLCYSDVPNPRALWEEYKPHLYEDLARFQPPALAEKAAFILLSALFTDMGKDIESFHLADFVSHESFAGDNTREILAEVNILVSDTDLNAISTLNIEQRVAFDTIMAAVHARKGGVFFVDGPGGTGKSFVYRCLLAATRTNKWIALATASSGIAASILPGGRTAHSRFKLPFDGEAKNICNIGKQSAEARLLREARLILWDEASMANRMLVESLDTTMRDILSVDELFGGRVMVFGGDFRQTLPVVRSGTRHDFIDACLLRSITIWPHVQRLRLVQNMRAHEDPGFCAYLLRIGNGTELTVSAGRIKIPPNFLLPWENETVSLDLLFSTVYPDLCLFESDPYALVSRVILTTKNEIVDFINSSLLQKFPGEDHTFLSYDVPLDLKNTHCQDYLHTLSPAGLPPHKLNLKRNCPIMLLRNLNPCEGLCNGTRLICDSFGDHILSCYIAAGDHKGKHVFIPKIPLEVSRDEKCHIPFKRTQFPVKLCFAMTINKSQGQTLDFVGIYLKEPVFSHGQLYVAMSRARNADSIKIIICPDVPNLSLAHTTPNVVFDEILPFIN